MLHRRLLGVVQQYGHEVAYLTGTFFLQPALYFEVKTVPRIGSEASQVRAYLEGAGCGAILSRARVLLPSTSRRRTRDWVQCAPHSAALHAAAAERDWKKRLEIVLAAGYWPARLMYFAGTPAEREIPATTGAIQAVSMALQRRFAPLVPWVAKVMHRERKRPPRRTFAGMWKDHAAFVWLTEHLLDVADWLAARRPADLLRLTILQVKQRVTRWERRVARLSSAPKHRPVSPVVFEQDGYQVERLETRAALAFEGRAMRHCVSTYASQVESGQTEIYAVVDKDRVSRATVEVGRTQSMFGILPKEEAVRSVLQVRGVENASVTEEAVNAVLDAFCEQAKIRPRRWGRTGDLQNGLLASAGYMLGRQTAGFALADALDRFALTQPRAAGAEPQP